MGSSLNEAKIFLIENGIMLWHRKRMAIALCWAICIIGWIGITLTPRKYEADARAYIDVNGLLTPLLKGMVVSTASAQGEEYLRQTLLSRPNLEQVIVLAGLGNGGMNGRARDELVATLGRNARITQEGKNKNLVEISYTGGDPVQAKNVVQALLTIFAERATSSSRVEMEKAQKFLDAQIGNYENELRAAEIRRAEFRKQYAEILPDSTTGKPRQQVISEQLTMARQQYAQAVVTRDSLAAQVRAAPALLSIHTAPVVGSDGRLVAATPQARLQQAQRTIAELRLRYTDDYPDLKAALHDELELRKLAQGARSDEGSTQISNPVYEQLRLKLVDAQVSVPALKQQIDSLTEQYQKTLALSSQIPDIEAKSKALDRDYDVIKNNYDELAKRREAASLSQAADNQADRTQFRVVDPPVVPMSPSFPNLPLMYSLILFLGIIGGAGVPLALAYVQPTFVSASSLRSLGLPVIGTVTRLNSGMSVAGAITNPLGPVVLMASLLGVYTIMLIASTGVYRWLL